MVQIQPFRKENDVHDYRKEIEILVEKLAIIDKKLETLQQHEDEIVKKRVFDEKISKLENIIAEKDARICDFVRRVNKMEVKID